MSHDLEPGIGTSPNIDISAITAHDEAVGVFGRILSIGESRVARMATVFTAVGVLAACGAKAPETESSASAATSTSQSETGSATPSTSSSTNGSEQGGTNTTTPGGENTPGTGTVSPSAVPETQAPAEKLVGHIDVSNLGSRAVKKAEALASNPSETDDAWKITEDDIDPKNYAASLAEAEFVVESALLATVTSPDAYKQFLAKKPAGMTGKEFPDWAYQNLYLPKLKAAYGASGASGKEPGIISTIKGMAWRASVLNDPSENAEETYGKKFGPYTYVLRLDTDSIESPKEDVIGWKSTFTETMEDWTDLAIYLSLSSPEIQGKPVTQTIIMAPRNIRKWPDGSYAAVPAKS